MKKILIILLFSIAICNSVFAESYYFKKCSLNKTVSADYLIDLENKIINVVFKSADGKIQKVKFSAPKKPLRARDWSHMACFTQNGYLR